MPLMDGYKGWKGWVSVIGSFVVTAFAYTPVKNVVERWIAIPGALEVVYALLLFGGVSTLIAWLLSQVKQ